MKVFQRTQNIVSRRVAGELFLVPVAGNLADMQRIFTLTKVAEFIWDRLDGQRSSGDILNDVVEHFDVDEKQAESDIQALLTELLAEGLVQEVRS
jgi:hypothetical protein